MSLGETRTQLLPRLEDDAVDLDLYLDSGNAKVVADIITQAKTLKREGKLDKATATRARWALDTQTRFRSIYNKTLRIGDVACVSVARGMYQAVGGIDDETQAAVDTVNHRRTLLGLQPLEVSSQR